jgi:hypothetical protein
MTSLEETPIADLTPDQAPLVAVVLHSVDSAVVDSHALEGVAKASMQRSPQKRCSIGSLMAGLEAWVVVVVSAHLVRFNLSHQLLTRY